jgi:chromosome partitioning protein
MGARRLIVAMPKGGSGKTATAVAFARGLARARKRVLLVDLDPQGSATAALGAGPTPGGYGARELLLRPEVPFAPAPVARQLHLVPAFSEAITLEVEIQRANRVAGPVAVLDALERVENGYDYVICDCGPNLGAVTYNALAAGPILVPVETTRLAVAVLPNLTKAVRQLRGAAPGVCVLACLPTRQVARQAESRESLNVLHVLGGRRVLGTVIPQSTAVARSLAEGMSLFDARYRSSKAPAAYLAAIDEVVSRLEACHG